MRAATSTAALLILTMGLTLLPRPAQALNDAHWKQANEAMTRGIEYLKQHQNEDGSWSPKTGPAVTALAVTVMLERPNISADDPAVAKAVDYILDKAKPDGGIHEGVLQNYNTAICLSALSRIEGDPRVASVVSRAQRHLKELQWKRAGEPGERSVDRDHPYFGGAGYGHGGRPDMSNTNLMIQALRDSGVPCTDPAYKRAVRFITRTQGVAQNEMHGDAIEQDGGFIYSTTLNTDLVGVPESKANPDLMDKAKALEKEGVPVEKIRSKITGLRTYGSMTYAGLKSYIYAMPAQMTRDDPRVKRAMDWIRSHYTLKQNPGMPKGAEHQGQYYYYMTFGRAMDAWGASTIRTADDQRRDWANDLIEALTQRQQEDGSWTNTESSRWMEDDPNLVTAYALIALQSAID